MPTAQIYFDEIEDAVIRKLAAFWKLSKNDTVRKLVRLTDHSKITRVRRVKKGDEDNGVQSA